MSAFIELDNDDPTPIPETVRLALLAATPLLQLPDVDAASPIERSLAHGHLKLPQTKAIPLDKVAGTFGI